MKKTVLICLISMSGIFGMVDFLQAQDTIVSPVDTTEYITHTFSPGLFSGTSSFTSSLYDDTTFPGNVIVDGNLGLGVADPLEKLHIKIWTEEN